jgi:hypothetical protein
MMSDRRKASVDALLEPMVRDMRLQLSAFPPRTRACLAAVLAARVLSDAAVEVFNDATPEDLARILGVAGDLDAVCDTLCDYSAERDDAFEDDDEAVALDGGAATRKIGGGPSREQIKSA